MLSGTFSARAYAFFDTLAWIAGLNLLWIASTLLGAGVFGAGPATAAAHILVRKRARGEAAPLVRGFAAAYTRNFVRANILALPVMGISVARTFCRRASSSPRSSWRVRPATCSPCMPATNCRCRSTC